MIFIIFLTNWFVLASVILSYKTNDFFIKKINLAFRCVTLIFSRKLATHTLSKKKNRWKLSFLIPATFPHMPWTRKNSLLTKRVLKALRIGSTSSASLASKQMQYQWQLLCHCSDYLWVFCRQHASVNSVGADKVQTLETSSFTFLDQQWKELRGSAI